jgi:hypothetical protein
VKTDIAWAGLAKAITVKASKRPFAANLKRQSPNILRGRHRRSFRLSKILPATTLPIILAW